jgi:hypothetical protein
VTRATRASSRRGLAEPNGRSRRAIVPAVGGLFSPQSKSLGLDQGAASPALLEKITYAGTVAASFAQASAALHKLADLPIPEKQVERVTERIGHERLAERDNAVAAFQALPLASRFAVPQGVMPPALAVVMVDGGRLQTLDRRPPPAETPPAETAPGPAAFAAATPTAAAAPEPALEWEEERAAAGTSGHWREERWACA